MIKFQKLKYKNFLSFGNKFTEIDFENSNTTLITGHNGAGKSSMLCAISFVLFGKPHRNVTKNQLVNSITGKGTVVEVEFNTRGSDYKVVRGIKPGIFEIWKDGELVNQSSHSKEYQKILEQNILKLNYKSFHQIVVLGSSTFVPFMQLPTHHRREVIEDLLDMSVFSKMNIILKEKISILKEDLSNATHQLELNRSKQSSQSEHIEGIQSINTRHKKVKQDNIDSINQEISELQSLNGVDSDLLGDNMVYLKSKQTSLTTEIRNLENLKSRAQGAIDAETNDQLFWKETTECPKCHQDLSKETCDKHLVESNDRIQSLTEGLSDMSEEISSTNTQLSEILEDMAKYNNMINNIEARNRDISRLQSTIVSLQSEIQQLDTSGDIKSAKKKLKDLEKEGDLLLNKKLEISEDQEYNTAIYEMLKDSGIKTKIVKQYIPVINNLVNKYLQLLDFHVQFNVDENFQESIKSSHRDGFSYSSFSEGEKAKIDISLVLTWRHIAKLKNSVSTNLLILDEIVDSSIDQNTAFNLMKVINEIEDTNVFVISHRSEVIESDFETKIVFEKQNNFSNMTIT